LLLSLRKFIPHRSALSADAAHLEYIILLIYRELAIRFNV